MNTNEPRTGWTVGEMMSTHPIVIGADEPLKEAARILEEKRISGVPVVDDEGTLVGILSGTDLVRAQATEHLWTRWPGLTVRHLMHTPVLTVVPETSLQEAAALMERGHVHRLVVVDEDGRVPVGIISTGDLVRSMVGESGHD